MGFTVLRLLSARRLQFESFPTRSAFLRRLDRRRPAACRRFVYGQPDKEFDNRWDLVDPDDLTWAQSALLVYNRSTGEVVLDTTSDDSGYITGYNLTSDAAFQIASYRPALDVPFSSSSDSLMWLVHDVVEPGRYNLGAVLPRGLTATEFEESFLEAEFLGRAGFLSRSFDFATEGVQFRFAVITVPEPSTGFAIAILACAVVGMRYSK